MTKSVKPVNSSLVITLTVIGAILGAVALSIIMVMTVYGGAGEVAIQTVFYLIVTLGAAMIALSMFERIAKKKVKNILILYLYLLGTWFVIIAVPSELLSSIISITVPATLGLEFYIALAGGFTFFLLERGISITLLALDNITENDKKE